MVRTCSPTPWTTTSGFGTSGPTPRKKDASRSYRWLSKLCGLYLYESHLCFGFIIYVFSNRATNIISRRTCFGVVGHQMAQKSRPGLPTGACSEFSNRYEAITRTETTIIPIATTTTLTSHNINSNKQHKHLNT